MSEADRAALARGTLTSGIDLAQVEAAREAVAGSGTTSVSPVRIVPPSGAVKAANGEAGAEAKNRKASYAVPA